MYRHNDCLMVKEKLSPRLAYNLCNGDPTNGGAGDWILLGFASLPERLVPVTPPGALLPHQPRPSRIPLQMYSQAF